MTRNSAEADLRADLAGQGVGQGLGGETRAYPPCTTGKPLPRADLEHIWNRGAAAFEKLDRAAILVTGASGFLGSWMLESARYAQAQGCRFGVTGHFGRQDGDLRTLDEQWFRGRTHILHAAAVGDSTVDSTKRIVDRADGAKVVLLSSGSVVSKHDPAWRDKLRAELYAGMRGAVIARGYAMLGPRLPAKFAAAQIMADAVAKRPIRLSGTGATIRTYLYAADVCVALWRLLAFGIAGTAVTVGSDQCTSVGQLARFVADLAGVEVEIGSAAHDAPPFVPPSHITPYIAPMIHVPEALRRWYHWEITQ